MYGVDLTLLERGVDCRFIRDRGHGGDVSEESGEDAEHEEEALVDFHRCSGGVGGRCIFGECAKYPAAYIGAS